MNKRFVNTGAKSDQNDVNKTPAIYIPFYPLIKYINIYGQNYGWSEGLGSITWWFNGQ